MNNFFHTVLGRYNISDRWLGLDYGKLFLDPIQADLTLAHEMAHGVLAMEDFGQASSFIIRVLPELQHLKDEDKKEIGFHLTNSQLFTQEGFATYVEISQLRRKTTKNYALSWVQKNLPSDYLSRFNELVFTFDLSQEYRDFFTSKISHLAMENGARRDIPKYDLLKNKNELIKYLNSEDINPDLRLKKMLETLRSKSWLVTKSLEEIAKTCGIKFNSPTTKEECANFLTYLTSFTKNPRTFLPEQVGETPKGVDAFASVGENMIIGNMNLNIADATVLFKIEDFLFYTDKMQVVFLNPHDKDWEYRKVIKLASGTEPEIGLVGFIKTGEKYLTLVSKEKATEILNSNLKESTLMVKWGGYDITEDQLIWSKDARKPDAVIYNTPKDMLDKFTLLLKAKPKAQLTHLHAGAGEDHPLQTLILKIDDIAPIHIMNTFGNRGISEILALIKNNSKIMTEKTLKDNKKHLNNIFALWMNLHWDIDWIETMINKEELIFRK